MVSYNSIKDWRDLEERVLEIFLSLGYNAKKNAKIEGTKAIHEVDIWAFIQYGGLLYRVVVECKFWNTNVNKAQVGNILTIVTDIGAEKGVIISKVGFQKGAKDLVRNSNIELYTFEQFLEKTEEATDKWFRYRIFDLINSLRTPFYKFQGKCRDKAEQMDEWWVPSEHGNKFIKSLDHFEIKLNSIDNRDFPRVYPKIPFSQEDPLSFEPEWVSVDNKLDFLRLLLQNFLEFEKWVNFFHDEIFSE